MRELVESEEGHSEVEKVEKMEDILKAVETKQDNGFEAGGRVGDTREYFEGDIGIKHKCNELYKRKLKKKHKIASQNKSWTRLFEIEIFSWSPCGLGWGEEQPLG